MKSLRNVSVYDFNYSIIKNRDVDGIFFFIGQIKRDSSISLCLTNERLMVIVIVS